MISVTQAQRLIAELPYCVHRGPLLKELDSLDSDILAEDILADRSYPPFDRVAMDGVAILYSEFVNGQSDFPVEGCQAAGSPQMSLKQSKSCFEVMTGASLPKGCDTVIPYEQLTINAGKATIQSGTDVVLGQNIHGKASDYKKGDLLLKKGQLIRSPEVSILASVGKAKVKVAPKPRIAVVSTGDELVPVGAVPLDHQIRSSNSSTIRNSLREYGFRNCDVFHIDDDASGLFTKLEGILNDYDLIILSGGVSKGKFDFVPQVLNDLRVDKIFHRIKQKPGKPMWAGKNPEGKVVFALPGNPVSVMVCLHRYVLPFLQRGCGDELLGIQEATLTEDIRFAKDMTYFAAVAVTQVGDQVLANPVKSNGSGDFSALSRSHGFIELPQEPADHPKGSTFPLYLWREGRL